MLYFKVFFEVVFKIILISQVSSTQCLECLIKNFSGKH